MVIYLHFGWKERVGFLEGSLAAESFRRCLDCTLTGFSLRAIQVKIDGQGEKNQTAINVNKQAFLPPLKVYLI